MFLPTQEPGIATLFAWAARNWKGWDGARVSESLEGEFRLELSCDRLGHVALAVALSSDGGLLDAWSFPARLGLDAGQLEAIARELEHFFRTE